MRDWLHPVRAGLDSLPGRADIFFRDDDAGWADDHLLRLVDLFERFQMPIDLAVIPAAAHPALARELSARAQGAPHRIGLHQHGWRHANHELEGRKCEFGPSRSREQQAEDIARGRERMGELFGDLAGDLFTPPWNRCTAVTLEILAEQGFTAVSRDLSAARASGPGPITELPITIDWFGKHVGVRMSRHDIGRALARRFGEGRPVGIMLHHAWMDEDERIALGDLLSLLARHERVRCRGMAELIGADRRPIEEAR